MSAYVWACVHQVAFNRYRTSEIQRGMTVSQAVANWKRLGRAEKMKYCTSRKHTESTVVETVQIDVEKEQHREDMLDQVLELKRSNSALAHHTHEYMRAHKY